MTPVLKTISPVDYLDLAEAEGQFDDALDDIEYDSSMDSDVDQHQFPFPVVASTDSGSFLIPSAL